MTIPREAIPFPCGGVPDDAGIARLVGLYPQVQEGLWMQRVKVLGGALTGPQWRALAQIVREQTPTAPLHLTTRQDVELHDVAADRVGAVQTALAEASLTSLGACGDTLRNVTVCPCSGAAEGTADLAPLAWRIRALLESIEGIYSLPRKFKISLSACEDACAQPWINDLGFVAEQHDGQWFFRAVVAGSLGARPGTGMLYADRILAREVPALCLAAVTVFAAHGDRERRTRARLRHVRQRLGDDAFRALLDDAFDAARADHEWPDVELPEATGGLAARVTLTFANGDVTPAAADALAALTDRDDLAVRIANHHRVILLGPDEQVLREALSAHEVLADASRPQAAVVACPGKRWCSRGLTDTNGLADRIRAEVGGVLPAGTTVCISGCPNGCAHSGVADVGLNGGAATVEGERREVYDIRVGGGMGRDDRLGERIEQKAAVDRVIEVIRQQGGDRR
jgi:sulfite reductase (ferredoxin)